MKNIPGNTSLLQNMQGIRKQGILHYVGAQWTVYGDLFQLKMGPKKLVFPIHPDAVRHISITNRPNYDKLNSYEPVRKLLLGNGVLTSTGDLWRTQRKLLAPFYTPRAVQEYAQTMLRDGQRLVERWEQLAAQGETVIEISEEMTFVAAAIILRAMFSMETNTEVIRLKDAVETMIAFSTAHQRSVVTLPLWMPTQNNRHYHQSRASVHDYINDIIAQRRAVDVRDWPDDLLTRLMQAQDEETGNTMSQDLLRDEAVTTFFAGHETTARTLTYTWYALAKNPEVAARLAAELDAVLGTRAPTLEDMYHLPYTLQVIKETLRLYSPVPFYIRDAVADDVIDGHHIPAGAMMMLSPYYTHRHPDFWPDPLRFDPERWTPEREKQQHPNAFHAFAAGQRICIGNNFSLLESQILLAMLAQKFAPRLIEGFEPQWVTTGTLGTTNGMPMIIERRQQHAATAAV